MKVILVRLFEPVGRIKERPRLVKLESARSLRHVGQRLFQSSGQGQGIVCADMIAIVPNYVLVTSQRYNVAGWVDVQTDPKGIQTKKYYDALGRVITSVANYTGATSPGSTTDVTTNITYDGNNNQVTVTAMVPGGTNETTEYVYLARIATGSKIDSNDILTAVWYPNKTTGSPSNQSEDLYTVNALGQNLTYTDRNLTLHTYTYNVLGRQTVDAVTLPSGSNIDVSVMRIQTQYNALGTPSDITTYTLATGGVVVSDILQIYNSFGQLLNEFDGFGTNAGSTGVAYVYSNPYPNSCLLVSMTYPNSRTLSYNYDGIGRVISMYDGAQPLELDTYLGLNTLVQRVFPQVGLEMSYIKQSFGGQYLTGGGDTRYTGLDLFGRVVDQYWFNTGNNATTDRFQYTYDRDSDIVVCNNLAAGGSAFSQTYTYNYTNQVTSYAQGTLSGTTISNPTQSMSIATDAVGNWTSTVTNGTLVGTAAQPITYNALNQQTSTIPNQMPTYDNDGNMITDKNGNTLTYDAWNHVVQVSNGGASVYYAFDGLGRRDEQVNGGTTLLIYFSATGQEIEDRSNGTPQAQYVWSTAGPNLMVERDNNPSIVGFAQRVYVQQNVQGSVTALFFGGAVAERYVYSPFGKTQILGSAFQSYMYPNQQQYGLFNWTYLFQGGQYNVLSKSYIFGARTFDPTLGKWQQNDPLGLKAGDANTYRAMGGNPVNRVDPSGELEWSWEGAVEGAEIGAGVGIVAGAVIAPNGF